MKISNISIFQYPASSVLLLFFILAIGTGMGGECRAATRYMCNSASACNGGYNGQSSSGWETGSDSNNGISKSAPWLTLKHAFASMSGGDTLIIGSGTYTGVANEIGHNDAGSAGNPPLGNSFAWTTIQADISGGAVFDGEQTRPMFYVWNSDATFNTYTDVYWIFQGLVWGNMPQATQTCGGGYCSVVTLVRMGHVKFLQCGAYDAATHNTAVWSINQCKYTLLEGCYAWGSGRIKYLLYGGHEDMTHNQYNIIRNCVARNDVVDNSGTLNPTADFDAYDGQYLLFQNNISVDADGSDGTQYNDISMYGGCFGAYSTSTTADNITFQNSICVNSKIGGLVVANNHDITNVSFLNNLFIGLTVQSPSGSGNYGSTPIVYSRAVTGDITNNSFINCTDNQNTSSMMGGNYDPFVFVDDSYGAQQTNLTNSLFYNNILHDSSIPFMHGYPLSYSYPFNTEDYNNMNGNAGSVASVSGSWTVGANDINTSPSSMWPVLSCTNNLPPQWSGISGSTNMCGVGQSGANMGVNLVYQQGKSGTMWGDTGYNLPQDGTNGQATVLMWPYPNEDLIKTRLAAYNGSFYGVTGARGFAAGTSLDGSPQTLTKYIWEYLGNQIPAEVYGSSGDVTSPGAPENLTVR